MSDTDSARSKSATSPYFGLASGSSTSRRTLPERKGGSHQASLNSGPDFILSTTKAADTHRSICAATDPSHSAAETVKDSVDQQDFEIHLRPGYGEIREEEEDLVAETQISSRTALAHGALQMEY